MISDHARSYNASFVSKLCEGACQYPGSRSQNPGNQERPCRYVRLLYLDARGCEAQRKQTAISHDAKVGGRCHSYAAVIIRRVFHGVWIEPPRAKLKHWSCHNEGNMGESQGIQYPQVEEWNVDERLDLGT